MANIFVIDDEPILLDLICKTLSLQGHRVTAFGDGNSLFESLPTEQPPIDLLLTDVEMKPIGGFEVARKLNEKGFTGPVLFMSGYMPGANTVVGTLGGRSMLEKPFTAAQLRAAVSEALSSRISNASLSA